MKIDTKKLDNSARQCVEAVLSGLPLEMKISYGEFLDDRVELEYEPPCGIDELLDRMSPERRTMVLKRWEADPTLKENAQQSYKDYSRWVGRIVIRTELSVKYTHLDSREQWQKEVVKKVSEKFNLPNVSFFSSFEIFSTTEFLEWEDTKQWHDSAVEKLESLCDEVRKYVQELAEQEYQKLNSIQKIKIWFSERSSHGTIPFPLSYFTTYARIHRKMKKQEKTPKKDA